MLRLNIPLFPKSEETVAYVFQLDPDVNYSTDMVYELEPWDEAWNLGTAVNYVHWGSDYIVVPTSQCSPEIAEAIAHENRIYADCFGLSERRLVP